MGRIFIEEGRGFIVLILPDFHPSSTFPSGGGILVLIWSFFFFLAVFGLCCCTWAFSSCGERGLLFVAVHRLLIVVDSLVAEHGLWARGLQ